MLAKKNRVDTRTVEHIFTSGKILSSPHLTFKFILTDTPASPRVSFLAPKSVAKLAVTRNMLRRRGYKALQTHITRFPAGLAGVFIFKIYHDDVATLENEIKSFIARLN